MLLSESQSGHSMTQWGLPTERKVVMGRFGGVWHGLGIVSFWRVDGDTLVIVESQLRRLSFYDGDGHFLTSSNFPSSPFGLLSDGTLIGGAPPAPLDPSQLKSGLYRPPLQPFPLLAPPTPLYPDLSPISSPQSRGTRPRDRSGTSGPPHRHRIGSGGSCGYIAGRFRVVHTL